nr:hypothetical protein [Tanacetum cinerariifolium]
MATKRARTTRANPDPTRTTTATKPMTQEAINNLIAQRVTKAIAEYKTQKNSVVNGDTSHTTRTGPRTVRPTRECTYKDYLNYLPLKFNDTKGVIGLTQWFKRTESVSSISNCIAENQVKFASCTLIGSALTWWNSYMRAVSQEASYAMPWKTLRQMITAKYCPRGEIKKLEVELWNLKVKGTDEGHGYHQLCSLFPRVSFVMREKQSSLQTIKWIKNYLGLLIVKPITKGSLTILQGTNKTNNHSKGTTMLHRPMLQGLEKRNHTEEPNLCALNATSTMMDHVVPNALTARGLAI